MIKSPKTSPAKLSPTTPPRASAQDRSTASQTLHLPTAASPAFSSASTADGEGSSPELPPLPAPRLPERVLGLLRTPPASSAGSEGEAAHSGVNQWGSPYPPHLRAESSSSEHSLSSDASGDLPIHRLELQTPFLRVAPPVQDSQPEVRLSGLSAAATVLANRARRLRHGITEGWIRQHTAGGSDQEKRHWFSDGTGDSENSSLSGSFSGEEADWLGYDDLRTPKARSFETSGRPQDASRSYLAKQSSSETLKQSDLDRKTGNTIARMPSSDDLATPASVGDQSPVGKSTDFVGEPASAVDRPRTPTTSHKAEVNGAPGALNGEQNTPLTPSKAVVKQAASAATPRLKKKIPWKGKTVMVSLPKDDERGLPGKQPFPLTAADISGMLRSWQQLGYNIDGFDLYEPTEELDPREYSQSRGPWPDFDEMVREREQRGWRVLLPDLNAWKKYVDELNEAKLRALGVSFGDEDPAQPSISPASTSRQASVAQYPPLPFSPPIPTSSASSNQAISGFPFTAPFATSAAQSPGIPTGASPSPFGVKFNPRASVSIPSPRTWSPQLLVQQGHHMGSPSLANLGAMMSPTTSFSADGMPVPMNHQRHQSLQYPTLPHQFQPPTRASPRLQDLREVDEEAPSLGIAEHHEPGFVRHNPSESLQKEIDEAEYHLEEQMRSQLENDEDYSPHNETDMVEAAPAASMLPLSSEPSTQFAPQAPRFGSSADGLVLHHPRPHSRGHSLSQKYFTEDDATNEGGFKPTLQRIYAHPTEDSEIETNPSNLGTPIQTLDFAKLLHQRSFSTASNPWTDKSSKSADIAQQPRPGHGSKSSFSKLNVEAPEFKFDPTSSFNPGAFRFSANAFQPLAFNIGVNPANSSQPSVPATNINVNAPAFAPGRSDFSFSSAGPKFRPDAPTFMPNSLSTSITSPMSGAESGSNRTSSIFGNIDLSASDIIKPTKQSKAIPIVRPDSLGLEAPGGKHHGSDDHPVDEPRFKRARASVGADDAVPRLAESTKENTPVPEPREEASTQGETAPEEKSFDESNMGLADTTLSSTIVSETTDTKATASPSATSPDQATVSWAPFEFKSTLDMQAFNDARPFGFDKFHPGHKKSLSATAKAFVPGATIWAGTPEPVADVTGELTDNPTVQSGAALESSASTKNESVDAIPETSLSQAQSSEEASESILTSVEKSEAPVPSTAPKGLSASRYARSPPPPPKRTGLSASRFAATPSPVRDEEPAEAPPIVSPLEADNTPESWPLPDEGLPLVDNGRRGEESVSPEPTMDHIDEVMRRLNENPDMGVNKTYSKQPQWRQPTPIQPSLHVHSEPQLRSEASSPDPGLNRYRDVVEVEGHQHVLDDPFVDPPHSALSTQGAIHHLNGSESLPASDWEGDFTDEEQDKLESRVNFFDGRVHELVGGILAARLGPLEQTLESISNALAGISRQRPPSQRARRSISAEIRESDADDEDDEAPGPLRPMSPRRDRKLEQIRAAVLDAMVTHQRNQPKEPTPAPVPLPRDDAPILNALMEMKEHLSESIQPAFRSEDLKHIIEEAVGSRIPVATMGDHERLNELQARIAELEQRLGAEEAKLEAEISAKRAAENRAAEIDRELQSAATRIEVEMMNKSALNQRIADLEDRVHHAEQQAEVEVKGRRAAEDRLSEVQRLLRISSEEEVRLRELVEEKEQKIKSLESTQSKNLMRLTLLEANQANAHQAQGETQNRINTLEAEAREARKEAHHWRSETDRIVGIAQRRDKELAQALDENKALHKLIDTLGVQLQENEHVRDNWRSKFMTLQEEMARAAKEMAEEIARRTKKEQSLLGRQEVLEARLQAEARTRERIETELERLEMGERQGMRAVAECKRLEAALAEMRTENHKLHQSALRYQAEFQEARESAAREVKRTRDAMQTEVDNANHQVNVVREELEDQVVRLRAQLDNVKMDADTAKARHEMLLEEAQTSKQAELEELVRKHQNEIEDLQARYERQLSNTSEEAQRTEQNLLERLSISTSKWEHLQDKVAHLEEKLEIAKEAARAAAQAAKSAANSDPVPQPRAPAASRQLEPPEKISPQALRESIMVLQEQLQEREQRIEELEVKLSKTDPDAEIKISKRDDEITWLRELLAVRHSDLQDIIGALSRDDYDRNAVKDAAIRLKANLQMEEQERERAMNGGSAINLPNIAATIRDAATPRVAQAVGPLAAAWGNWRKGRDLGSVLSSPAPASGGSSTPSRSNTVSNSLLGGLLTPPASGMRQTPPTTQAKQPTAFSSTGRRFTAQDLANRPRPQPPAASGLSKQEGKAPAQSTPPRRALSGPVTPPMMRPSAYDSDAHAEDFDDAGFFEDD